MSDIYAATLRPTKPEAVAARVSSLFGVAVAAKDVRMVASFRFDDPAGDVGCETHIVAVDLPERGDIVVQVPLTYRGAPLEGAPQEALVTIMDHSVLGRRWVYDAAHDPIYVTELLLSITDAGSAAQQYAVADDGSRSLITEGLANVRGTGPEPDPADAPIRSEGVVQAGGSVLPTVDRDGFRTITRLRGAAVELFDVLNVGAEESPAGGSVSDVGASETVLSAPGDTAMDAGRLVATWDGQESPVILARVVR